MTSLRERLARWIERRLPQPRLRQGATGSPRRPVKRIIVFGRIPNPTFDYYLAARLEAPGMPPYEVADIRGREAPTLEADGAFVILCRYASPSVLRWIERNAERLSGVGLFLDDDIPAVVTGRDADFFYRLFLWYRALWPLRRLNRHLDLVWASTPHLASRLAVARAAVLPPAPPPALWNPISQEGCSRTLPRTPPLVIAYHATGVHLEEHRFLSSVIADVLRQRPEACFEVFADHRAEMIWKGLERVKVQRPMKWDDYLLDAEGRRIDIMLVPLSPSRANDSRAPTKRIDVARYRAAGIFSQGVVYGNTRNPNTLLLPYDKSAWHSALLKLLDSEETRVEALRENQATVAQMALAAENGLDFIFR